MDMGAASRCKNDTQGHREHTAWRLLAARLRAHISHLPGGHHTDRSHQQHHARADGKKKKKSCLLPTLSFQLLVAAEHGRGGRGPPWRLRLWLCCLPAAAHGSLDVLHEGLQLVAEENGQRHRDRHRDHVLVQTPAEGEQAATPPSNRLPAAATLNGLPSLRVPTIQQRPARLRTIRP